MRKKGFGLVEVPGEGRSGRRMLVATAVAFAIASPLAAPATVYADGYSGPLKCVEQVQVAQGEGNVVDVTFNDDVHGKITFLDNGVFRYNVDPEGEFSEYAEPRSEAHVAKIQAQPDNSDKYDKPAATVSETDTVFEITAGDVTVVLEKATGKLSIKAGGKTVMREKEPLSIGEGGTVQTLGKEDGENFFGGGTQNGRFIHTGKNINIVNESTWVDGGVASPNPFYWSSDGYGVLRNTFAEGSYDFGKSDGSTVTATHNEDEFDAYYFVSADSDVTDIAQDLLRGYFDVTGNPVLLPEYAFYLGHLNAYNRDSWSTDGSNGGKAWSYKDSVTGEVTTLYEKNMQGDDHVAAGQYIETLNGALAKDAAETMPGVMAGREFSARAVIDRYAENDMPLGWFLPNDGYGAGYGQNGYFKTGGVNEDGTSSPERLKAVADNVENLREFTEYANANGVATGLWTQSDLKPDSNPGTAWQRLRDFEAEVKTGGVTALKTDVAWVGDGYSFALDGVKQAYDIVTTGVSKRPNIVSLDGWAGTQRYAGIWTGDQYGGDWEYIRFHVPTYIGQSLSGNPNIGSDTDAIYDGEDPVITTRDYQWKAFTPLMLDMDGWGSKAKTPFTDGDPYTGISRMYLKLKSQLMPYIYTTAASAANIDTGNGDTGLPIVRAMLLEENNDYTASTEAQYQYMLGDSFLVAPIYEGLQVDEEGNDVRNGIYLPGDENDIWIDYWSGTQYRGGQVLNNFEAPLWKLPVFVKANAIIPMYEANNNPQAITETNPEGLDRTKRITEFFATEGEGSFTGYEDDGSTAIATVDESDEAYGSQNDVTYGGHVSTKYTSKVGDGTGIFTIGASEGSYEGYEPGRESTFVVNLSGDPAKMDITAQNGDQELALKKAENKDAFDAATPGSGEAVYFYDAAPNLNTAPEDEAFSKTAITTTPKLYVKFAKTDVSENAQTLTVKNFSNTGEAPSESDPVIDTLAAPAPAAVDDEITPTSIKIAWETVDGATSYDLLVDGRYGVSSNKTTFIQKGLPYDSSHTYRVRARNSEGVSEWSEELTVRTALDPWRNTPSPVSAKLSGEAWGGYEEKFAFDHKSSAKEGCMLSGYNADGSLDATGWHLDIDYGLGYQFESLDYYTSSFGYAQVLKVESSLDGAHWTDQGTYNLEEMPDPDCKSITFEKPVVARYVRLTCEKTRRYFTAAEICLNKVDGTKGFAVGSLSGSDSCTDLDYNNLDGQVIGVENRGGEEGRFATIASHYLDLNGNGAYDVYDLAHFMAGYAPNDKDAKAAGKLEVTADRASAKAGDVVTVQARANGVENANALGALVHFDDAKYEFVGDSLKVSDKLAGMKNRSVVKTKYTDGKQSVNVSLVNEGKKDLYSGEDVVATFQLKAKVDVDVDLESSTWVVGSLLDFSEGGWAAALDKDELRGLVDAIKAEGLSAADYTVDSWKVLELALADAERLLADGGTTQETVDQCLATLKEARENLVKTSVDPVENPTREQLGELVSKADAIDTAGKTEASAQRLADAIARARKVFEQEGATPEQLKQAYDELRAAIDGLEDAEPIEAARAALKDLIAQAEKIDTEGKTAASVTALADAISAAKEVLEDENASAADLDAAATELQAAIDGLEDAGTVPPTDGENPSGRTDSGELPKTGDDSALGVMGAAAASLMALGAGVVSFLRGRGRQR